MLWQREPQQQQNELVLCIAKQTCIGLKGAGKKVRGNTLKTQSCAKEEKKKTTVKACECTTTGTSSIERNKIMDEKKKRKEQKTRKASVHSWVRLCFVNVKHQSR